jgi:hypothetical protein
LDDGNPLLQKAALLAEKTKMTREEAKNLSRRLIPTNLDTVSAVKSVMG